MTTVIDPMKTLAPILNASGVSWALSSGKNGKVKLFVGETLVGAWAAVGADPNSRINQNLAAQVHRAIALEKAKKKGILIPDGVSSGGGIIRPQPGREFPRMRA